MTRHSQVYNIRVSDVSVWCDFQIWDMTHSYVWHDSIMCVTWLRMTHMHTDAHTDTRTRTHTTHLYFRMRSTCWFLCVWQDLLMTRTHAHTHTHTHTHTYTPLSHAHTPLRCILRYDRPADFYTCDMTYSWHARTRTHTRTHTHTPLTQTHTPLTCILGYDRPADFSPDW